MIPLRLKDISFRTSVMLPSIMMAALIMALSWWLYSGHKNNERQFQQQRATEIEHLKIATDFASQAWIARVTFVTTWANPRDLNGVAKAESALSQLDEMAKSFDATTEVGRKIKTLIPTYVQQTKHMFDYYRLVDKAVKYGVLGSGDKFRKFGQHVATANYSQAWKLKATEASQNLITAGLWYNGFVAGMRINYLDNALEQITSAVNILKENQADPATAEVLAAAERYQTAMQMLDSGIDQYHTALKAVVAMGDELTPLLSELQNVLGEFGYNFADASLQKTDDSNTLTIQVLIAGLIAASIVATLMVNQMSTQLSVTMRSAEAIGNRDLSQSIVDDGKNEFGELSRSLDKMRVNIQTMLSRIVESSAQLSTAAEEVSAISVQTSANMQDQQSQLDSLSAAMEEMRSTSLDIANNAENSATATNNAAHNAKVGGESISDSINQIRLVEEEMGNTTDSIHRLVEESQRIGSIVDVINSIAEQTNLLALNAAIEAARAGDQGRGFAVVADEVRSLATRTQASTEEIGNIIKHLQEQAVAAEMTMNESVVKIASGVESVNRSGEVIEQMNQLVSEIFDMSSQIASATEQQTAVSDELGINVAGITKAASEVTEGSTQTSRACEELSTLANNLHSMTSQFKI
ncbi:methyl-accepting chemotaxis protein [Photobacterium aquae]|uniref:methyl-accepting chemotaxis protein n=1 Tax=Photobacterium aquae TaxID=1195763 RepID=UPI000B2361B6|nr:HAMP domain-containing methyl-accepting chemotaxis protein [Photobacterium aquae]